MICARSSVGVDPKQWFTWGGNECGMEGDVWKGIFNLLLLKKKSAVLFHSILLSFFSFCSDHQITTNMGSPQNPATYGSLFSSGVFAMCLEQGDRVQKPWIFFLTNFTIICQTIKTEETTLARHFPQASLDAALWVFDCPFVLC